MAIEIFQIGTIRRRGVHHREVVLDIHQQTPHRRGHPGVGGHNHRRDTQLLGHLRTVQGAGTAKGDQAKSRGSKPRRIDTSRTASAMLAFATLMTACAASAVSSDSGWPIRSSMTWIAFSRFSSSAPPARTVPRRFSARLASVLVGSEPPRS